MARRNAPPAPTKQRAHWPRAPGWRAALESGGITPDDRVLLGLPLAWSIGADCRLALSDLGALTLAAETVSAADMVSFRPTVIVGTPTDVLRVAHTASSQRVDLAQGPLRTVVVTGEPGGSIASTRRLIEQCYGARCLDVYALSELGAIGWGCIARIGGILLNDRDLRLDVVDPDTGQHVPDGELGELVVTTPEDWETPLVGFHTGDLARLRRRIVACGTRGAWAEGGVLGRVSELLTVRGSAVFVSKIEEIVRRHPAVVDFRLRVYARQGESEVAVQLEPDGAIASESDRARVAAEVGEDVKRSLGIRLQCDVVAPDSFAADQDDRRRALRVRRA
jgi:phenylacetate-CoA ligase